MPQPVNTHVHFANQVTELSKIKAGEPFWNLMESKAALVGALFVCPASWTLPAGPGNV